MEYEIKAVRFSLGVRCGSGSTEEIFIDVEDSKHKGKYRLVLDEAEKRLTIFNSNPTDKKPVTVVWNTNIAYHYPFPKDKIGPKSIARDNKANPKESRSVQ